MNVRILFLVVSQLSLSGTVYAVDKCSSIYIKLGISTSFRAAGARRESSDQPNVRYEPIVNRLIEEKRFQEAIWYLQDAGLKKQAQALSEKVAQQLETSPLVGEVEGIEEDFSSTGKAKVKDGISALVKTDRDDARREVGVYKLDQMLGTNVVPVTVFRQLAKKMASFQYWVKGLRGAPESAKVDSRLFFLDYTTAQSDRGGSNSVRLGQRRVAIDNAMTFASVESKQKAVLEDFLDTYGDWPASDFILPADVLRQASQLSNDDIFANLKGLLTRKEIAAAIARKDVFLKIQPYLVTNPKALIRDLISAR